MRWRDSLGVPPAPDPRSGELLVHDATSRTPWALAVRHRRSAEPETPAGVRRCAVAGGDGFPVTALYSFLLLRPSPRPEHHVVAARTDSLGGEPAESPSRQGRDCAGDKEKPTGARGYGRDHGRIVLTTFTRLTLARRLRSHWGLHRNCCGRGRKAALYAAGPGLVADQDSGQSVLRNPKLM